MKRNYKKKKNKVLFLGNTYATNEYYTGGAIVLAKELWEYLSEQDDIDITHKQLRHIWKAPWQIFDYIWWTIKAPFVFWKYDIISFHATQDFIFTTAPFVWLWAKLLGKKINFHFFGTDFYKQRTKIHEWLIKKTILQSDHLFIETKYIIKKLADDGFHNSIWLPNARKKLLNEWQKKEFEQKFVFISMVNHTKGIDEILQITNQLPDNYTFDIYGPITAKDITASQLNKGRCQYKGILKSDEVQKVLQAYDVLVLPTHFSGEGYPGIIIEAFSVGRPVISTKWRAIPEILKPQKDSLMIKPKDQKELLEAILFFNKDNYPNFSKNAFDSFEQFDKEKVFKKMLETLVATD